MPRRIEDLAVVVELATLTDDLTRSERAALKRVAGWVDRQRNVRTITNPRWDSERGVYRGEPSDLVALIEDPPKLR